MEQIIEAYGPYGFGLVVVLVVWFAVVKPHMKFISSQSAVTQQQLNTMNTTALVMQDTAETNKLVTQEFKAVVSDLRLLKEREQWQQIQKTTPTIDSTGRS